MRRIAVGDRARLRPVLELSPGDVGRSDTPEAARGAPVSSRVYWRECLIQTGLLDVTGVSDDSWLLYADEVARELPIRNLVTAHVAPILREIPVRVDRIPPLAGGFALVTGDEPVLTPGCCGDLGDLREWESAAAHDRAVPAPVWTGHPSLWVWREGAWLFLREDQEDGYPAAPKTVCIHAAALEEAIDAARRDVGRLLDRVLRVLRDVPEVEDPVGVANALVGRPPHAALVA